MLIAYCKGRTLKIVFEYFRKFKREMRSIVVLCVLGVVSCLPQTGTNLCGTDERGTVRQAGDTWQQDCNRCRCTDNLLPGCTKRFCGGFSQSSSTPAPRLGGGGGGVMFPGVSQSETEPAPVPHCTDQSGRRREVGEAWKEDCNNCRCGNTAVPLCTQRFCIDVEQFRKGKEVLKNNFL